MMFEMVISLILLVPGLLLLLFRGELEYSLSTLQQPAYSMIYHDIWKKTNSLLGTALSVGGIASLIVGVLSGVGCESSFVAAYTFISMIIVSEYSYRLFLSRIVNDPAVDEDQLEVIKGLSGLPALLVAFYSLASVIAGLASLATLYRIEFYSLLLVQVSLIILVLYVAFSSVRRPPFLAYPWLPRKWITRLSILVPLFSDTILFIISIIIFSSLQT